MLPDDLSPYIDVDSSGCWLWTKKLDRDGYAHMWRRGRTWLVHRLTYDLLVAPIPTGMELDHLCRVRHCVNPAHLEPVTHKENILRGFSPQAENARKTHCVNGHEFTEENTYRQGGVRRQCRACSAEQARRYRARKAA